MPDLLGLSKLPDEVKPIVQALMDRVDALELKLAGDVQALEAKTALDVQAIADKVIAGLSPLVTQAVDAVNTVTLTVNASVVEITALARRIDGAKLTVTLGPEIPDAEPQMTVHG